MRLARHHRLALAGALALSAVALVDAASHGATGNPSAFTDETAMPWVRSVSAVVHALAYAGAVWVLHAERRQIAANRGAAVFRALLVVALATLAAGFALVAPFAPHGRLDTVDAAVEPVLGAAFALQFLAATGLGLALLRHPQAGVGSRVLLAVLPVLAATVVLAAVAPDWAHPAYVETVTIVGTALLATATRPGSNAGTGVTSRVAAAH